MSLKTMPRKKEKAISEQAFIALLFPQYHLVPAARPPRSVPLRPLQGLFKKLHMVMYHFTGAVKYAPKRPLMKQHKHKCIGCEIRFTCRGRACDGAGPSAPEEFANGDVYCKHCWAGFSD